MTDERTTAYLLRELTEEEAERFEEEFFSREEWPADLYSAEQELIDAYLRNELSKDRRRRFEQNYLTTDARKARVLTAQSFLQVLCPVPRPKVTLWEKLQAFSRRHSVPQAAVVVLVLAIIIPVALSVFRGERSPQTFTSIYLAMSSSDRSTGSQTQKVKLPPNSDGVEIHLKLPESSAGAVAYYVQAEDVKNRLVNLEIKSQDAQSMVVIIRADELSPGQYILKLSTTNRDGTKSEVGNYFFTVEEAGRTR
jgi:hypothetical protein